MNHLFENKYKCDENQNLFNQVAIYLHPKQFCSMEQISKQFKAAIQIEWNRDIHNTLTNREWIAKHYLELDLGKKGIRVIETILQSTSNILNLYPANIRTQIKDKIANLDFVTLGLKSTTEIYTLSELKILMTFSRNWQLLNTTEEGRTLLQKVQNNQQIQKLITEKIHSIMDEILKSAV